MLKFIHKIAYRSYFLRKWLFYYKFQYFIIDFALIRHNRFLKETKYVTFYLF